MGSAGDAQRTRFEFLDGLRGVAAIAVLVGHLKQSGGQAQQGNFGLAVDLFFILSGFVVMHAYGERLSKGLSFWTFVKLRIVRLYPMLAVATAGGLAVAGLVMLGSPDGRPAELLLLTVLGLLCLPVLAYRASDAAFPLNPPQWSLFFEFAVNLAFAVIAARLTPMLAWMLTLAGAAMVILSASHFGYTDTGSTQADFVGGAARVLFGFFCGAALFMARRVPVLGPGWAVVIAAASLLALWPWWDAPVLVRMMIILLLFPVMIHAGASVRLSGRALDACRFLGAISYPLYILHTPLMGVTGRMIARVDPDCAFHGWWVAGQAALFILASWLMLRFCDEPLRAFLSRRLRPAKQSPAR